jgi:hypothetical protein
MGWLLGTLQKCMDVLVTLIAVLPKAGLQDHTACQHYVRVLSRMCSSSHNLTEEICTKIQQVVTD